MASAFFSWRSWDRASLILAMLAATLGVVVYLELAAGLFSPGATPKASASLQVSLDEKSAKKERGSKRSTSRAQAAEPDRDAAEAQLEAILARPIFSPSRRAAAGASGVAKPAAEGLRRYRLAATVQEGERSLALLQGVSNGEYLRLAPGDRHGDWRLVEVAKDGALFQRGEAGKRSGSGEGDAKRLIVDKEGARLLGGK